MPLANGQLYGLLASARIASDPEKSPQILAVDLAIDHVYLRATTCNLLETVVPACACVCCAGD